MRGRTNACVFVGNNDLWSIRGGAAKRGGRRAKEVDYTGIKTTTWGCRRVESIFGYLGVASLDTKNQVSGTEETSVPWHNVFSPTNYRFPMEGGSSERS